MGRRFPGTNGGGGGGGGTNSVGEFNEYEVYRVAGTYTWTKPSRITGDRIRVYVWGAGGCGNDEYAPIGQGAGGGGLAIKFIDIASLGSTESIVIGQGSISKAGVGGTSSFGAHCSATGGNSGANNADNQGLAVYSAGGIGIGGDINRRGGLGGTGYNGGSTDAGGGGGGSAPSPSGLVNGYKGGNGVSTRSGGGGGGIGGEGGQSIGYAGGGGGGSLTGAPGAGANYYGAGSGGAGVLGAGGSGATVHYHYASYGGGTAEQAQTGAGSAVITPNQILFGGGGGGGGHQYTQSTYSILANGANGGPGAGGGGLAVQATTAYYASAGNGGTLGGGGGAAHYCYGGHGGNGGGGGGNGYGGNHFCGKGGDGLVIIQYRVR